MTSTPPIQPPTIGHMKSLGLTGVWVSCTRDGCKRSVALEWDKIGLPDDLPFPEIPARRRFVCSSCGAAAVSVTPDWREYRFQGMRKRDP